MSKVTVSSESLHAVLSALNGPEYLIRELQVTRNIESLTGVMNPINQLIREFNEQVAAQSAKESNHEH